jgi:CRISPR/Cas system endoribonuclease Cas6 (RAMP superfamily)
VSPPNEKQTRIYNLIQNVDFSTMVQNEEYIFLYTFMLLSNEKIFYYHGCKGYFVTCMLPYGETNLLFSSPRFCFLRNWINGLENEKYLTTILFLNLVFLKP